MANFLCGCDVGTGGTKAVVMDLEGRVLGTHFVEYPLLTPRPGWAEHQPDWYWNAVCETIGESIRRSHVNPRDIKGVSISALSPGCILVDKNLQPLQNCHIWMDRRATAEVRHIKERVGDDRVFKLSANPIDGYYATAKLLWEQNNRPELYKKAFKLQTAADYPAMRLTGRAVTDYSNASLIGIAFDIVNKKWDTGMLEEIGLDPEKMPQPYPCEEIIGEVTGEAAKETGLAAGTPVVAGTVDCNAAWVAGGAVDPGDVSLVMGTAGVLGVVHEEPKFTRHMITIVHTAYSKKYYTTLAALVSCGALYRYFRDTYGQVEMDVQRQLGVDAFEIMNIEAERAPVGSNGLIILPYFMGERTPIWDPLARGVMFGLSLAHRRPQMLRGMMEAVGYGLLHNFELIKASGIRIHLPMMIGEGGAHSRLWRQIIADVLNVDGVYMKESKGAPVGNAVLAGVGVGLFKDFHVVKDWVKVTDEVHPNPENHKQYMKLYKIYRELYEDLKERFVELAHATGYV